MIELILLVIVLIAIAYAATELLPGLLGNLVAFVCVLAVLYVVLKAAGV